MSKQDDLMYELLQAKRNGEIIYHWPQAKTGDTAVLVEEDHVWDLQNNIYKIRRRREYIIQINDRDKKNPIIHSTENQWTASDFGRYENGEYILMREVYPEEM